MSLSKAEKKEFFRQARKQEEFIGLSDEQIIEVMKARAMMNVYDQLPNYKRNFFKEFPDRCREHDIPRTVTR